MNNPAQGRLCNWWTAIWSVAILSCVCAIQTHGQNVAEAARQEKARKTAEQNHSKYVYTEDDFKRQVILMPQDQARAEAHKRQQDAVPSEENAEEVPRETDPKTDSLGEVARRYRQEKAAREAELTSKKKFTPFPYKLREDPLAVPEPGIARLIAPDSGSLVSGPAKPSVPGLAPNSPARVPRSHGRLSPFQPRPLTAEPSVFPRALLAVPPTPRLEIEHRPPEKGDVSIMGNRGMQRVTVQQGQSWWKLAELYLGNGARWPELKKLNPDAGAPGDLLKTGTVVVLPQLAKASQSSPARTVEVQRGDSLWSLAKEHLGRGSAWTCLARANPTITDYTHLIIGMSVQLPEVQALKVDNLQK